MAFLNLLSKPHKQAHHQSKPMEPTGNNQQSAAQAEAASTQIVTSTDEASTKKQTQCEPQSLPKPPKKRYISKQSMAFMNC